MIPLRFRAWHKEDEKILHEDDFICFSRGHCWTAIKKFGGASLELLYDKDEIVVMQSTGLKDKNGKEIFEGDVLEEDLTVAGEEECYVKELVKFGRYKDEMLDGVVADESKQSHLGFYVDVENGYRFPITELVCIQSEIIGNIYDNPELLTSEA